MKNLLLLFLFSCLVYPLFAQTPDANGVLYVKEGGNGSGNSWSTAFGNLGTALDAARSNTAIKQIWVAKGSYQPASGQYFSMVKGVKIYGHFAGTETSLSQRNLASTDTSFLKANGSQVINNFVNKLTTDAVLDGFVLTGTVSNDAISNVSSSPAFSNIIVKNNNGWGVLNNYGSPVFTNVVISGNADGGMYNTNNSSPILTNVVISGNAATEGIGGIMNYNSTPQIRNSIILGNQWGSIKDQDGSNTVITNSLVQGVEADAANGNLDGNTITAEQVFVSPVYSPPTTAGDYRLKAGSPALDHGNNSLYEVADGNENNNSVNSDKDVAGNPRLFNNIVDMGAYESQGFPEIEISGNGVVITRSNTPSATNSTDWGYSALGLSTTNTFTIRNTGNTALSIESFAISGGGESPDFTITEQPASMVPVAGSTTFKLAFKPSYAGVHAQTFRIKSNDPGKRSLEFIVIGIGVVPDASGVLYIKKGSNGAGNSWKNAMGDFGAALDVARSNTAVKQIWVAKGSYEPSRGKSFSMVKGVKIYGHFAGTETSLSQRNLASTDTSFLKGNGSGVISNDDNNLTTDDVLDGFVVTAAQGDAIFNKNSSPAFTNMIIRGNEGAGLSNNNSNPVLTNVVIVGNYGSGLYNRGSKPLLMNVTISGNSTGETGGAMINYSSIPDIRNSIILGNKFGIDNWDGSSLVVTHSLVEGTEADAAKGNLDGNSITAGQVFESPASYDLVPTTAGDYRLKPGSPAINKGSNSLYEAADGDENNHSADTDKDLAGNPRLAAGTIDLGAYESQAFPEINIQGNAVSITDGDATPSAADSTNFGSQNIATGSIIRTYTIQNTGDDTLFVSSVTIGGAAAADYSISSAAADTVLAGTATSFAIRFDPSERGARNAIITVNSNDADEAVYDFAVTGEGIAATAISFSPASSKTYGDEDFELNAGSNSPEPVGYSSSNTAVATVYQNTDNNKWYAKVVGAGTATITASQNAGSSYSAGKADAVVTVDKAILTIKANGQSKVYGDADPAFTYGATGFKNNDDNNIVTGGLSRAAGENAGKYAIGQNDLAAGDNYAIEYTGNNLTITKAALTVKANEQSKVYGEEDPTLTYVASGFKNNDGNSVIKGKLGRSAGENVGAYAIAQNTLTAGDNYTIEYSGNNLTITKATLTVKANEQSKVYGENDPTLTYVATGFKNNDGNSVIKGKLGRAAGENVGAYAIGQNTLTAGDNYTVEYTGNDLTITKATLTVKANERSKVYGEEDPTLTYVATGFKNNDGNSIIRGKLSRAAGEDVGEYAIGQNTLTAGSNYTISYGGNTFTITKAAQTITWNQELVTGCNDGNPITLTATASSSLPVTYTVANTSVATISGNTLTPGEYGTTTVTATQEGDKNHMPATAVVTTYYYVSPALVKQHFSDALYSVNDSSRFVQWQWYKNGVAVSGATRPYYSEATALNGSYYIVATDKDGNNVQSCLLVLTGNEMELKRLKVYPNPANPGSMVTVSNNYSEVQMQGARLIVTNTSGVVLQQVSNVQPATKIKMPPTGGIYIITLILSNGAQQTVNVLVK